QCTPYTLSDYGIRWESHSSTIYWIVGLSVVLFFFTRSTARQAASLAIYPEIRWSIWSKSVLACSVVTWWLYFIAYELLYRGFLFFACERALGLTAAIAINCAFYCITHIPKGVAEAVGSIPLGVLMCYMTWQTGTIWLALFAHVALSMFNLFFSLKYHTDIQVKL
ncbi:MAG: CPBP family intramembrane glutamic endopeptidase, partial [Bacteroidota bacterium]